jgi:tetrahydromethanopterin S-methyltransferase subunit G
LWENVFYVFPQQHNPQKAMKRIVYMVALACSAAVFYQCSPSSKEKTEQAQEEVKKDINKDKEEITKNLQSIRDDINARLDKITVKLDNAKVNSKAQLEEAKESLTQQRERVEKSLDEIDKASETAWGDIQQRAHNTADDAKIELQRWGDKIDAALKEKS